MVDSQSDLATSIASSATEISEDIDLVFAQLALRTEWKLDTPYLPMTPFYELPYFHGYVAPHVVASELLSNHEFILFLNPGEVVSLVLGVRYEAAVHFLVINQNDDGFFLLKDDDGYERFHSVKKLIEFYSTKPLPIGTIDNEDICLRTAVINHNRETKIECAGDVEALSFYHDEMTSSALGERLGQSGDYLLWSSSEKNTRNGLTLSVRWECELHHIPLRHEKLPGLYMLPNIDEKNPSEYVDSVDAFVKSLVRSQTIWHGVQLKRAVRRTDCLPDIGVSLDSTATDSQATRVGNDCFRAICGKPYPYAYMNYEAPVPVANLPYYFGSQSVDRVKAYLKEIGDYLLFRNEATDRILLAFKTETSCHSLTIWHIDPYYYLDGTRFHFKTVEELVTYFHHYSVPVPGSYNQYAAHNMLCLRNAVINKDFFCEMMLEREKPVEDLSYYHQTIDDEIPDAKLELDGDYVITKNEDDELEIVARWRDCLKRIPIQVSPNGYYAIPDNNDYGITEYVESVDEFVKVLVRSQILIDGIVLKRAIRRVD